MPSTYEHKALIEQLRNLSAEKTASENPSEEAINTSHPSGDSSVDDDGTTPATTGERYAENTSDDKAMNPSGTESAPTNSDTNYSDSGNPGVDAETDTSATSGSLDDPIANDPGTAHPVGKEATNALLKEASEIGVALRKLIKSAEHGDDDDAEYSEESSAEESSDEESSDDSDDGEDAAKESAYKLRKMSSEIHQIEATLKEAADRDADAFASVLFGVLKQSMPMPLMAEEEAPAEEEDAEEVLAQMAMADAAPAEEETVEEEIAEEVVEEATGEEAPAEEEILEAIAPDAVAEEEAPAEAALSPEEEMMLMQLLGSEGMAPEDVEAYGKMSALLETGQIKGNSMSKTQRDYFTSCHQAAKTAQARFDTWKSSAALSNELNGIYQRGAK